MNDKPSILTPALARGAGLAVSLFLAAGAASANAKGEEFYKGKTVTYIVATAPGGNYDTYARLVAEYMQKHLPGSTFVVKNMPGAGHLIGANSLYAAKPDGLTIGTFNTGLIYNQISGREGVRFDLTRMSWIGKASADPRVVMVAANSPFKTFQDLQQSKTRVNFGASGVGSASFVESTLLIETLKLPVKLISNFNGNEGEMGLRRGELAGIVGSRSSFEPFVANGYGRFLAQIGGNDKDVPQLASIVKEPKAKSVIALIQSQGDIARLTAAPPGVPQERLAALRTAYAKALADKELLLRMAKLGLPVEPAIGDDVLRKVRVAMDQPPEMVALIGNTLNIKDPMVKAEGPLLEVLDKGREIVFNAHDGQKMNAKPSGSRTTITIAGKEARREDLKAGMHCDINYKTGGDEPVSIDCK